MDSVCGVRMGSVPLAWMFVFHVDIALVFYQVTR
jgi:hypothetical protein